MKKRYVNSIVVIGIVLLLVFVIIINPSNDDLVGEAATVGTIIPVEGSFNLIGVDEQNPSNDINVAVMVMFNEQYTGALPSNSEIESNFNQIKENYDGDMTFTVLGSLPSNLDLWNKGIYYLIKIKEAIRNFDFAIDYNEVDIVVVLSYTGDKSETSATVGKGLFESADGIFESAAVYVTNPSEGYVEIVKDAIETNSLTGLQSTTNLPTSGWDVEVGGNQVTANYDDLILSYMSGLYPYDGYEQISSQTMLGKAIFTNSPTIDKEWKGVVRDYGDFGADVQTISIKKYYSSGLMRNNLEYELKVKIRKFQIDNKFLGHVEGMPTLPDKDISVNIHYYTYEYDDKGILVNSKEELSFEELPVTLWDRDVNHLIRSIPLGGSDSEYEHWLHDDEFTLTTFLSDGDLSLEVTSYMKGLNGHPNYQQTSLTTSSTVPSEPLQLYNDLPFDGLIDEILTDENGVTTIIRHERKMLGSFDGEGIEQGVALPDDVDAATAKPQGTWVGIGEEIIGTAVWEIKNGFLIEKSGDRDALRPQGGFIIEVVGGLDIIGNVVGDQSSESTSGGTASEAPYDPGDKEAARKRMEEAINFQNFKDCIDGVIVKRQALSAEDKYVMYQAMLEKWGPQVKEYMWVFDEDVEADFIRYIYEAAYSANQNEFGVTLSPEEIAVNFLAEGGVELFRDEKFNIPLTKEDVGDEVEYYGGFETVTDEGGTKPPHFKIDWETDINIPIKGNSDDQFKYNGVMVDVFEDERGNPFIFGDGTEWVKVQGEPGSLYKYYGIDFEIDADGYIVTPLKLFSIEVPEGVTEVDTGGEIYEVFQHESVGNNVVKVPSIRLTHNADIPSDQDFIADSYTSLNVKENSDGTHYVYDYNEGVEITRTRILPWMKTYEEGGETYEILFNSDGNFLFYTDNEGIQQTTIPIPSGVDTVIQPSEVIRRVEVDESGKYYYSNFKSEPLEVDQEAGSWFDPDGDGPKEPQMVQGSESDGTYVWIQKEVRIYEAAIPPLVQTASQNGISYDVYLFRGQPGIRVPRITEIYSKSFPSNWDVGNTVLDSRGRTSKIYEEDDGRKYYTDAGPYYSNHNLEVSGYGTIGGDIGGNAYGDITVFEHIQNNGGIFPWVQPKNEVISITTERGEEAFPLDFNTMEDGIIAMAGYMTYFRNVFENDYTSFHEEGIIEKSLSDLTETEKAYWLFGYYNTGEISGKTVLRAYNGIPRPSTGGKPSLKENAGNRAGFFEMLQQSGIFSEDCTKIIALNLAQLEG